jgi:hypothetical protein
MLLAVVLCGGLLANQNARAATELDKIQSLGRGRYLVTEERSEPARDLDGLTLSGPQNLSGHIVMTVGKPDSVWIKISKVMRVESVEIAAELDGEIDVQLRPRGKAMRIDIQTPTGAPWEGSNWSVTLDLMIIVPANWILDFDTRHFEYDLEGPFGDVRLITEFGRVKLTDVTRSVDVRGSYTGIELADIRGVLSAKTAYADLAVRRAIPAVDQPARLANDNGPITVTELAGAVIVETRYAPIRMDQLSLVGSTSRVLGESDSIDLNIVAFGDARLDIQSSYAPVTITVPTHLSARLNVTVGKGGTIRTSGLEIQTHPDLLGDRRLEGICGAGEGGIDIRASGMSQVELRGQ